MFVRLLVDEQNVYDDDDVGDEEEEDGGNNNDDNNEDDDGDDNGDYGDDDVEESRQYRAHRHTTIQTIEWRTSQQTDQPTRKPASQHQPMVLFLWCRACRL